MLALGAPLGDTLGDELERSSTKKLPLASLLVVTLMDSTLGSPESPSITSTKPGGFISTTRYAPGGTPSNTY